MGGFLSADNILLIAMVAGLLCVVCSKAIDDFFKAFVQKKFTMNRKEITAQYIASGCFGSIFVGLIFYAFAYSDPAPIKMIATYSVIVGIAAPILSNLLIFAYSQRFSRH